MTSLPSPVTRTAPPSDSRAVLLAALQGAEIRAGKSTGWERFRALARVRSYRAELATLAPALAPVR